MTDLHLDTHAVIWLYTGKHDQFPDALRQRLAVEPLRVSPMVRLELTYLHEIGRLMPRAGQVLDELERSVGLVEDPIQFDAVAKAAEMLTWTRDPFDRMIAAHALVSFATLVTKDEVIRKAMPRYTVWD